MHIDGVYPNTLLYKLYDGQISHDKTAVRNRNLGQTLPLRTHVTFSIHARGNEPI